MRLATIHHRPSGKSSQANCEEFAPLIAEAANQRADLVVLGETVPSVGIGKQPHEIAEAIPVIRTDMKKEEAEKLGAEHEFGATYPDMVSVYSVGPLESAFSIEFCGGPHVSNTRELGEGGKKFKIVKEEASSAGIRRIKAVLE